MKRIEFCWELGAGTGHVTTLLPIAAAMQRRGHSVRFLLRHVSAAADLAGAADLPREGAPIWNGPPQREMPRNFGEILLNFGYHDPQPVKQLIEAWRERLQGAHAMIANVAPAAHLACRTLGIPRFEISQGFHAPPAVMPAPPLRDWEPHSRRELEAADRRVLRAINIALAGYGAAPIESIGEIMAQGSMLLTYPELDIYPERGASEYFGITNTGEGSAVPAWPEAPPGSPRLFAYLYHYYDRIEALIAALDRSGLPTLAFCRGLPQALKDRYGRGTLRFSEEPMAVSRLLPQCDAVICHGSHQMTAQALLAGKPALLLPTQLEQFLIMRRVVRQGAGLGIAPEVAQPDFGAALRALTGTPGYAHKAREFMQRYASHDRDVALATIIARVEEKMAQGPG
jgi:UDP:flavonoid glycosyltransferase YjiC (YdhE family)